MDADALAWARSGAMALTGPPARALGPPAPLVPRLRTVAARLHDRTAALGRAVPIDPLALLGERAACAGLTRRGRVSCGGGSRLLRTADGWLAVTLAREDDVELLPAWLGVEPGGEPWASVADAVSTLPVVDLEASGAALGLPVAGLATVGPPERSALPLLRSLRGAAAPRGDLDGVLVVDLSSLWAGPLCGSLLADAGADVVKVESSRRPDGARLGPPALFDLLNAGKAAVALDLREADGRAALLALVREADVVIEASRPRALRQLGIDADVLLRDGPQVWVSITSHGRDAGTGMRVGFGDDAAVAGGLVAWDGDEPCFCADAVADPVSGLVAATATVEALHDGGRWLLDVALAGVAAWLAGPTIAVPPGIEAAPPSTRVARGRARPLGADTATVLRRVAQA